MMDHFAEDLNTGLSAALKYIPSKYLYNKKGHQLFQAIMHMKEYYLTPSEYEIFNFNKGAFLKLFARDEKHFRLIDLGAGNALKTKVLIKYFLEKNADFTYFPVDISGFALDQLLADLYTDFPTLKIEPVKADYTQAMEFIDNHRKSRNIILFLGSNIGNFNNQQVLTFLRKQASCLNTNDLMMIGLDLQKDPTVILDAYNDPEGITREFTFNLLDHINEALHADFEMSDFKHYPVYDPSYGEVRSYLISKRKQTVTIGKLNRTVSFQKGEPILTEISRKYTLSDVHMLAQNTGFEVICNFQDCRNYFTDTLWLRDNSQ